MRLILDAGHGGTDPGCVLIGQGSRLVTTEREQNLLLTLTLKYLLSQQRPDVNVTLTRPTLALPGGGVRSAPSAASFHARTWRLGATDIYASVHCDVYNAGRKNGGVYFSNDDFQRRESKLFAATLAGQNGGWYAGDNTSNHGRLYIRDAQTPCAVLWEVAPLRVLSRDERIEYAQRFIQALNIFRRPEVIGK